MSESTKVHFYPHSLRSAALAEGYLCRDKAYFYLIPPKQAQTIEYMFLHLKMTFNIAVPADDRVLQYIGIGNEYPAAITLEPSGYFKKLDLNLAADANRKIDLTLNLTPILNKLNAGWHDRASTDGNQQTYVIIKVSDNLRENYGPATIELCKVDALYTTRGIR